MRTKNTNAQNPQLMINFGKESLDKIVSKTPKIIQFYSKEEEGRRLIKESILRNTKSF